MTLPRRRPTYEASRSFAAFLCLWATIGCTGGPEANPSSASQADPDAAASDAPAHSDGAWEADTAQGGAGGADTGGADTSGAGGTSTAGGGGSYTGDCYLYDSEGPDAGVELVACTATDGGGYTCRCGNDFHDGVVAESCEEALLLTCGVDLDAPHWCQGINESCWPVTGTPDAWLCDCGAGSELVEATAGTCHHAIQSACAHSCESALGSCEPEAELSWYGCTCYYYGSAVRSVFENSCAAALKSGCDPFGNGGSLGCNTPSGYCDQDDSRFDCLCIDGTTSTHYGGQCEETLAQACGAVVPPPGLSCDRQEGETNGSCIANVANPGWYSCGCSTSWDGGVGGWGDEVYAASCVEALESVCFPP